MATWSRRTTYSACFQASSAPCPHVSGHYMHASLFAAEIFRAVKALALDRWQRLLQ
jgi:hypothetical protein